MWRLGLVKLRDLKPHEEFIEARVQLLIEGLLAEGRQIRPILVDEKTMVILDGHHRVEALKRLGAVFVAALLVDYDSECVTVGSWREGVRVTKEDVRRAGLEGRLMPPRTSRHRLCFEPPDVNVPLAVLMGARMPGTRIPGPRAGTG